MAKKTINRQLSLSTSVLVILLAFVFVAVVEIQALKAKEPVVKRDQQASTGECVRCHTDAKTLRVMRMKEDGTNYLFTSDGKFKDPKFAALNPNYHHSRNPVADKALEEWKRSQPVEKTSGGKY